jgi:hypothetical protein
MTTPWLARRAPGPRPRIEDPQFRLRAIALASTGISRNGAAQRLGIDPDTLCNWLSRGRAQPDFEPYGSFAVEYLQAERGLEETGASAVALRVQAILERQRAHLEWAEKRDTEEQPPEPSLAEFEWVMRVMTARYPRDHGIHPHRLPEAFPDGAAWLERHALTQEQLVELFRRPPEPVQEALVEAADDIYALLLGSGWSPERPEPSSVPSESDGRGEDRSEGETGPRE